MICCAVHTVCYADMAIVFVGDLLDRSLTGSYPSSAVAVSERSEHAVVVFVCIYIVCVQKSAVYYVFPLLRRILSCQCGRD